MNRSPPDLAKPDVDPPPYQRLEWVDIAKAISVILIVLTHSAALIEAVGGNPARLSWLNSILTPIRVPLFFIASGFFARATVTGDIPRFLSRVLRLYWVFALWLALYFVFFHYVIDRPDSPVAGQSWWDVAVQLIAPQSVWFLWSLAVFFVLARIVMKTAPVLGLTVAFALSVLGMAYPEAIPFHEIRSIINSAIYFVFFLAPVVLPEIRSRLAGAKIYRTLALCAVVYLMLQWLQNRTEIPIVYGLFRTGMTVFGVAGLLLFARLISEGKILLLRSPFLFLGRHTLPIYVIHFPVMSAIAVLAARSGFWGTPAADYAGAFALVTVGVGAGVAIGWSAPKLGVSWLFALPKWAQRLIAPASPGGSMMPQGSG
jgi:uncharacterized membrane protein YcfT